MEKTDSKLPLPDEKKSKHLPLLLRLTRRVCVFLFLLLAGFVIFYISGSYQKFLDSNISLILKAVACTSIALFFFSAVSVLETFFFALKDRRILILFNLIFFVFTMLSSVLAGVFSLVVNKLSEGIVF